MTWDEYLVKHLLGPGVRWWKRVSVTILFFAAGIAIYYGTAIRYSAVNARLEALEHLSGLMKDSAVGPAERTLLQHEFDEIIKHTNGQTWLAQTWAETKSQASGLRVNKSVIFRSWWGWCLHLFTSTWLIFFTYRKAFVANKKNGFSKKELGLVSLYYWILILTAPALFYFLPPYSSALLVSRVGMNWVYQFCFIPATSFLLLGIVMGARRIKAAGVGRASNGQSG